MIVELIEGGFLAQTLLVLLVWVTIVYLVLSGKSVPDPLFDAGFFILGFYFKSAQTKISSRAGNST